jgi:hypothetical protein
MEYADGVCRPDDRRSGMKKRMMSVSDAARMMGRAGRGDCKRRNVDYRLLARMSAAARRKKALRTGNGKEGK